MSPEGHGTAIQKSAQVRLNCLKGKDLILRVSYDENSDWKGFW